MGPAMDDVLLYGDGLGTLTPRRLTAPRRKVREISRTAFLTLVAVSAILAAAPEAAAVTIQGTIILPDAVSYEYFGLNVAENIQTSNTVGELNYTGGPGCGGVCTAITALGSDPSAAVQVNEVVFEATGGGYADADLSYYVEYVPPTPPPTPTTLYNVDLHATDTFGANFAGLSGLANGQVYIAFGPAGSEPTSLNNIASYTFQDTDCVNACTIGEGNYMDPRPFLPNQPVQMLADTPYIVEIQTQIQPGTTNVPLTASVDPTFTATGGGRFYFSPGITSGVPEPASWTMMLAGLAGLGAGLRRFRRSRAIATA